MIWTPIKKFTMLIFVFVSILFVFYLFVLYGVINISVQYLSIIALIEIVVWLGIFVGMMRLMAYGNLKKCYYNIVSQSKIALSVGGVAQGKILNNEIKQFENKHPFIVLFYNFLS